MLQKPLKADRCQPCGGLVIGVILQARECGLRSERIRFADDGLKCRIAAQRIGVVTVLITRSNLVDPLAQHLMCMVLDKSRMAPLLKNPFEPFCERQLRVKLTQQEKTGIAGDLAAVKVENNFRLKTKRELSNTLCSHRSSVSCARLVSRSTSIITQFDGADGFFVRSTMNNPG